MACPAIAYDDPFVATSLAAIDCRARAIAGFGYQALATPGSDVQLVLTGLLTLFVALFGYRLMLGERPGVREGVLALAKIGIVLTLATSWASYRTLAYDLVFDAPAELVASVGGAAGLPGAANDLTQRLELVDQGFERLGELGIGKRDTGQQVMRVRNVNGRNETVVENAQQSVSIVEPIALALARLLFLVSAVGGLAIVRIVAGILLALGPLFAGLLLFDATRGWFVGWLRGLSATMIATFGIVLLLGVELALVEPWLAGMIARRVNDETIAGAPVELLAAAIVFAIGIVAMVAVAARVAGGLRLPDAWPRLPDQWRGGGAEGAREPRTARAPDAQPVPDRPRAAAVADAVIATQRREAAVTAAIAGHGARSAAPPEPDRSAGGQALARDLSSVQAVPLGQRARAEGRRTRGRISASATLRDRKA